MIRESMHKDYLKVTDFLYEQIRSNVYRPGDKIPSEYELCDRFRVKRYVVRQAVGKLVNMGWLSPQQGRGCFVNERPNRIPYVISPSTRFTDNMNQIGRPHCSALVDWELGEAGQRERAMLRLGEDEAVYRLEIARYVDHLPISVTTSAIPEKLVPGFSRYLPRFQSLYAILGNEYGIRPIRVRSEIEAVLPTGREAELLELPSQMPVLRLENLMVNERRIPVEYCISRFRGDRNQCIIEFEHGHAGTEPQIESRGDHNQ